MKLSAFLFLVFICGTASGQLTTFESDELCNRYGQIISTIKKDFRENHVCHSNNLCIDYSSQILHGDSLLKGNLELISFDLAITKKELLKLSPDSLQKLIREYNVRIERDTFQNTTSCHFPVSDKAGKSFLLSFICFNADLIVAKASRINDLSKKQKGFFYIFKFGQEDKFVFRKTEYK